MFRGWADESREKSEERNDEPDKSKPVETDPESTGRRQATEVVASLLQEYLRGTVPLKDAVYHFGGALATS